MAGRSSGYAVVDAYPSAIRLPPAVGVGVDVTSSTVHCPQISYLTHGLPDQPFFHRDQCAGGDRCLHLLLSQAGGDSGYRPQIVGLTHQFTVAVYNRAAGMALHIIAAELSEYPVNIEPLAKVYARF